MRYSRQATQALNTNMVPAPPSNTWGDNILHTIAYKKDTKLMEWGLTYFGKELIFQRNTHGNTVLHVLCQNNNKKENTLKIIKLLKCYLGQEFREYSDKTNIHGQTAYAVASRFRASQEIFAALANNDVEEDATPVLRVTIDSTQQEMVPPPPLSESHKDTILATSFYKGDLLLCEWCIKYFFGNDEEKVKHRNENGENAFHQLFRGDGKYAVCNSTRRKMIIKLRTHILDTWGVNTYIDMIGHENNAGFSVLSSAIKNGGDVGVVKELLGGISICYQKIIIESENFLNGMSPLDFAKDDHKISSFLHEILSKENQLENVEVDFETDDEDPVATDESLPEVENIIKNVIEPGHKIRDEEMVKLLKQEKKRKIQEIWDLDQTVAYLEQKRNKNNSW